MHIEKCTFVKTRPLRRVRGVGGRLTPSANKCNFFLETKINAENVLKRKNIQKYFVKFLQGYPLKTFRHHVLRVVWGWEMWVGTYVVMNDPLPDGIWQF